MFRKDIAEALQQRKEIRVDPFRQGFDHANSPQTIDLNAVRLCFQVPSLKGQSHELDQALVGRMNCSKPS